MVGLPQVITQAVAIAMVPAVAGAFKLGKTQELRDNINLGIRASMLIGMPCAVGIMALAEPILLLLFPKEPAGVASAAPTLMIMCINVALMSVLQTTTGILQGINKQMVPVKNMAIGAGGKIILTYILVAVPALNIKGAALGSIFIYGVALLLDMKAVLKYTGTKVNMSLTFVKPVIASSLMGVSAFAVFKIAYMLLGSNNMAVLIAIAAGVLVYGVLVLGLKAITKEEIARLPKGDKIVRILDKFIR